MVFSDYRLKQIDAHRKLVWKLKIKRLLSNPVKAIRLRLGQEIHFNFKMDFLNGASWPAYLQKMLMQLPDDFFTGFSLKPDSAFWLYQALIDEYRPSVVIECGSGISTLLICAAMGQYTDKANIMVTPSLISLEDNKKWRSKTKEVIRNNAVSAHCQLLHCPIQEMKWNGQSMKSYTLTKLKASKSGMAELLFIDGPGPDTGRIGVLPALKEFLAPGCLIILDDAARETTKKCIKTWVDEGLAEFMAYIPKGTGVAVLKNCRKSQ